MCNYFRRILIICTSLISFLWGSALYAEAIDSSKKHVTAKLLSSREEIKAGDTFELAIELSHQKGWHTYWKNPGDSGLPTEISWNNTDDLIMTGLIWPVPMRFSYDSFVSYGYTKKAHLLVNATLNENYRNDYVLIEGAVEWLECKDVCIPASQKISLRLKVGGRKNNKDYSYALKDSLFPVKSNGWLFSVIQFDSKVILEAASEINNAILDIDESYFYADNEGVIDSSVMQKFVVIDNKIMLEIKPGVAFYKENFISGVLVIKRKNGEALGVEAIFPVK